MNAITHKTLTPREVAQYLRVDLDDAESVLELAESVLGAPLDTVRPSKQAELLQDAYYSLTEAA